MATNVVKAQLAIIVILVAVYFLQVATPLRLHPDTVVLLSVAETAAHGGGYLYHGQPTVFPPGYPTLLAFLIKVNLARVWVIVGLNVMFVMIGLLLFRDVFRDLGFSEFSVRVVCMLSLLSFVFVKYSAIPLTDSFFFCISMAALSSMKRLMAVKFTWRGLIGSGALVIASVCIRRIGVALIPALLYTIVFQSEMQLYLLRVFRRKTTMIVLAASVAASFCALAVVWGIRTASTLLDLGALLKGHVLLESVSGIVSFRLKELGEIAANLPYPALPPIVQACIPIIGVLVLSLMVAGVAWRPQFGVVETYFVSYSAIILVWPFYDPRFWLPVIPLLMAYSGLALKRLAQNRITVRMVEGYVMMFVFLGISSLASDTRVSFSGSGFADLYSEGRYHSTYCAVWPCKDLDSTKVDPDGVHLLRYYTQR